MVSSAVNLGLDDLVQALSQLRAEHADDPEYQQWRAEFPDDWPM